MNLVHVVQVKNIKNVVVVYKKAKRETKIITTIEVKMIIFLEFIIL